jgi:hypothetical protein
MPDSPTGVHPSWAQGFTCVDIPEADPVNRAGSRRERAEIVERGRANLARHRHTSRAARL